MARQTICAWYINTNPILNPAFAGRACVALAVQVHLLSLWNEKQEKYWGSMACQQINNLLLNSFLVLEQPYAWKPNQLLRIQGVFPENIKIIITLMPWKKRILMNYTQHFRWSRFGIFGVILLTVFIFNGCQSSDNN